MLTSSSNELMIIPDKDKLMNKNKHIVHVSEVKQESMTVPENSSFGGKRQCIGHAIGASKLGYSLFTVPAGKIARPFHSHYKNEELIFIIEGEGLLRFGDKKIPVKSGHFIACLAGKEYPHQLINNSEHDLRYLVVSTMEFPEVCEYPDSNKIGVYITSAYDKGFRALYYKDNSVPYFDNE